MIVDTIICNKCGREKSVGYSAVCPTVCNDCIFADKEAKKKEYLDALKKLSVEERLEVIEEWMYDYRYRSNEAYINLKERLDVIKTLGH